MPWCTLSHVELFYAEKGLGEPLVFLNGLSGHSQYWTAQLRAFSRQFHCLALDNRDVGQSHNEARPYVMADLAADVAEMLHHLNLPPAHVVGLSMGGMIAQELALRAPDRVRSLMLVDTLARSDGWFQGTLSAFETIRRQVADTSGFFDAILPWWVSHRFFEESDRITWLRWLLRQNPHPQPLDGFLRQLDAMRSFDVLGRLGEIRCPVLVLAGEDDSVCPLRYSHQLAAGISGARLVVLPGVGHAPPVENAGLFNQELRHFLDCVSQTSRQPQVPVDLPPTRAAV